MSNKTMEQIVNYIRDILRKEGITGMDSINHCIVFVMSRMLDKNICKKTNIDVKYSYDMIMKDDDGDEIEPQDLYTKFYKKGKPECLIGQLVNKLEFKNIKFKLEGPENLKNIMKKMKQFDVKSFESTYDIIGTIYEIHLKSGTSNAMRDLGQYYTHRLVINYMIKLCDPKMGKGIIEKIVDPTMGTGGFLTMAIKYLNNKYKDKIDWTKNKENIIGFDIDDNVRNMALINVFLEIGELCENTIVKQDTLHKDLKFSDDGIYKGKILEKAKIILANEPMGLKNIVHASCCDRIKNMKIRGTKAEPLFLQLFCELLDDGGRCAVIVPDGVLFNDSSLHNDTRKYIIENFNLKKIIALDDGFFLNTGVKTSIMFFEKDGKKTEEVEYSMIKLNNGNIEENSIIKVKYDDIVKNKYSLFANKYNVKSIEKVDGTEYSKLIDICDFLSTTKHTSSIGNDKGIYRFYNSSQADKLYLDNFEIDKESIIIGNGGSICVHYDDKFTPSKHVTVCQVKDLKKYSTKYLYYYLSLNVNILKNLSAGSTISWLNKTNMGNIEIPFPNIKIQKQIVEILDIIFENTNSLKNDITHFKKIMNFHIQSVTYLKTKNIRLGDVFNLEKGKLQSTKIEIGKKIPVLSISEKIKYTDNVDKNLLVDGKNIWICSVSSGTSNGPYETKIKYFDGLCSFTNLLSRFVVKDDYKDKVDMRFMYYYFENLRPFIEENYGKGSCNKTLNSTDFYDMKICILPIEIQKKLVLTCDEINEAIVKCQNIIKSNEELMNTMIMMYIKDDTKKESEKKDDKSKNTSSESESSSDSSSEKDTKVKNIKEKKIVKKLSKKEESESESSSSESSSEEEEEEEEKTVKKKSKPKK
jgi:type I restriction-modification system DNA methylase subunit/restriction endonuclease S subunit